MIVEEVKQAYAHYQQDERNVHDVGRFRKGNEEIRVLKTSIVRKIAADTLLLDQDDLVQKGYGWMLKEASKQYPDEVFDFVLERKEVMPRTALRYAIEKLSPAQRKEAMKKDFS